MDNKPTSIGSSLPTATNSTVNYHEVFSELVPVLTQCFGVILLGYIAGLLKIFSEPQAKGLNLYVTRFALPIVFFRVSFLMICQLLFFSATRDFLLVDSLLIDWCILMLI